jgi:hypothetical protein
MVRIFLIVSIVLSLGSAVVAFLTKGDLKKVEDEQLRLVRQAKTVVAELGKTTDVLEQTKTDLAAATKLAEDRQNEIGGLNRQLAGAKDEVAKSKLDKADSDKKVADFEGLVEKAKKDIERVQGLEKEMADLKASSMDAVAAKEKEIERLRGEVMAASKKQESGKTARGGAGEMEPVATGGGGAKSEARVSKKPAPKSGNVVSYDPAWNFAVISMGDRSGITPETVLYAMRGGATVAKLKVSKVYADRAVVFPEGAVAESKPEPKQEDRALIRLNLFNSKGRTDAVSAIRVGDKVVIAEGQEKKDERAAAVAEAKSAAAASPVPAAAPAAPKADGADPLLAIPGLPGLPADDKPAEKPAGGDSKDAAPDPFKLNFN